MGVAASPSVQNTVTLRSDLPVTLIQSMGGDHSIVAAAKVSTNLAEAATAWDLESAEGKEGFIDFLIHNRHTSPLEHTVFTVRVEAPIFVFREWHRHRTQSYNEMSGRYTKMLPYFYVPPVDRPLIQQGKPGHYIFVAGDTNDTELVRDCTLGVASHAWASYTMMMECGIAKEVARNVLPVCTYSVMYATMNLNNAFKFLSLRTIEEESLFPSYAQWEIENAARQVETHVAAIAPIAHASWVKARRF